MVLHCIHNNSETIVVSARDTDVLLQLVSHCDHVQSNNLWRMAGTAKIRKYSNIRKIYDTLSENTVPALLPYHNLPFAQTQPLPSHKKWDGNLIKNFRILLSLDPIPKVCHDVTHCTCRTGCITFAAHAKKQECLALKLVLVKR